MSDLSHTRAHYEAMARQATRLVRHSFTAWRLLTDGTSVELDLNADTLSEAVDQAAARCFHKDVFHVLERDTMTGTTVLDAYVVRQGKRILTIPPGKSEPGWYAPLKAKKLYSMKVAVFAPMAPFRVTPGCDVVGHDAGAEVVL